MNQKKKKEEQITEIRSELMNVNDQLSDIKKILADLNLSSEGGKNERNKRKSYLSALRGRK